MNRTPNGSSSGSELKQPVPDVVVAAPPTPPASTGEKGGGTPVPEVVDAGLRSLDHYKRALPKWRYNLRRRLLPLIRWETPYLAYFQDMTRTPFLDSYFAITANLGTHTFFMIGLPILFWLGFADFGKGLVHILAEGVFFTGFIKDMCSLPRPLSPPLQRITMSGSVALEYGFPSTHSTNAVSVAVYGVLMLRESSVPPSTRFFLEVLSYFYAVSIVVGRLYCGMHGFVDVIFGSVLGAVISLAEYYYAPAWDVFLREGSWLMPLSVALVVLVLVRVHPEPADDCPCFDDSVAFAGVVVGLELASWHIQRSGFAYTTGERFSLVALGWPTIVARMVFGVLVIFLWREVMKPTLLKTLPHLFRVIETHGLNLPRRFFVQTSEYRDIPEVHRLRTDNVMPNVSDFPNIVRNIRNNARRGRSVSIGPQSAADAYETLAYRERRRRESIEDPSGNSRRPSSIFGVNRAGGGEKAQQGLQGQGQQQKQKQPSQSQPSEQQQQQQQQQQKTDGAANGATIPTFSFDSDEMWSTTASASGVQNTTNAAQAQQLQMLNPLARTLAKYELQMGEGTVVESPAVSPGWAPDGTDIKEEPVLFIGRQDELGEKEIFEKLAKPRVRYDVEVVTKLIVYSGIAWLAVEGIPTLFEFVGLGMVHLRTLA